MEGQNWKGLRDEESLSLGGIKHEIAYELYLLKLELIVHMKME